MTKYITEYNGVQFMDKTGREKIKQLDTQYKDIVNEVGTETLSTTAQDLKGAINEVFQSASNGKILIANAITGKGVATSPNDTFQTMATNISNIKTGIEFNNYEYNQIQDVVNNYLDQVTYDPSDYTSSRITEFAPSIANLLNTVPKGKIISISKNCTINRNGYINNVTAGNYEIYNDVPNKITPIIIMDDNLITEVMTIKPTGILRQINCLTRNVRDLGGWKCDGGTIKYGKLFRGGTLNSFDEDIFLNQLGIKFELDLRGINETGGTPSVFGDKIDYVCTKNYTWYSLNNEEDWITIIRSIFNAVASNKPLYFHCAAGADRTGTVACVIECLLGVSQSDLDKDYELTSFASGSAENTARVRTGNDWKGLINQISSLSKGDTIRDKIINWTMSLGFTIKEINDFRKSMIDGSNKDIEIVVESYSVSNSLNEKVTTDSTVTEVEQYQPYSANINVEHGYVIDNVKITMDGNDITASAFNGEVTYLLNTITTNLENCSLDKNVERLIHGKRFVANVIPDENCSLIGAVVNITMGGVDVTATTYFSNGIIKIPRVTGNIVISISATKTENLETINVTEATAYQNTQTGFTVSDGGSCENGVFTTTLLRNTLILAYSNDRLQNLPAGDYIFKGEFKQTATTASSIAIYNKSMNNRLIKKSLLVGDVWTPFEYEFTLDSEGEIYFSGQQDTEGIGYLRNVQFIRKYNSEAPQYINLIPLSTGVDGQLYSDTGYKTNIRLSLSGGGESEKEYWETTGFMPCSYSSKIRIRGIDFDNVGGTDEANQYHILFYDKDKVKLNGTLLGWLFKKDGGCGSYYGIPSSLNNTENAAYFRICSSRIDETSIITVNQPITDELDFAEESIALYNGKTCNYTVGQSFTTTDNASYLISDAIKLDKIYDYRLQFTQLPSPLTTIRIVYANDSDIVTEAISVAIYPGNTQIPLTPTDPTSTQVKIRGYSDSSLGKTLDCCTLLKR